MASITYHFPGGKKVTYSSDTETKLRVILTTFWHYPVWLVLSLLGRL
jgi:hypothetical protein